MDIMNLIAVVGGSFLCGVLFSYLIVAKQLRETKLKYDKLLDKYQMLHMRHYVVTGVSY